jgi:hypothetical protein
MPRGYKLVFACQGHLASWRLQHVRTDYFPEEPLSSRSGSFEYVLLVCVRKERKAALLRRQSQGHRLHTSEVRSCGDKDGLSVRLQAQRPKALLRRQSR